MATAESAWIFGITDLKENAPPAMYKMDNYQQCERNNGRYCFFNFKIAPLDPNSLLWKTMKQYEHDIMKLDRSVLNRMICIPRSVQPESYGKQLIENELKGANATIGITDMDCEEERSFLFVETALWSALFIILVFTAISTSIHCKNIDDPNWPKTTRQKWFKAFSVKHNVQKLYAGSDSLDFQRLKCIQGLRVLSNVSVIILHTMLSLFQVYVDNIEELERGFANPIILYITFLGGFAVQVFFLISAFLLTNRICDIYKKQGQFTLRHCFILIVNRIIRFLPTLLIFMPVITVNMFSRSPQLAKLRKIFLKACTENWWYTLLQINFFQSFHEICTPTLWYLSADTLFYVATIVLLYWELKCKWDVWKAVGIIGGIIISRYVAHIYINAYESQFQLYPQVSKEVLKLEVVNQNYINPYGNWSSSLIGLLLGYTYNKYKAQRLSISNKVKIVWWLTFACVPPLVLAASTYSFKGIAAVIVGSILRPVFALSIGIGVLGMSLGLGGIVKTFLESNMLLVLSNVTYSTYLVHVYLVFAKGLFFEDLMPFRRHDLIFWTISDVVCSFALGALCAIFVEYPGAALQKMYVPQISIIPNERPQNEHIS